MGAWAKFAIFFLIIFLGYSFNNSPVYSFFSCSTPDYCPAIVTRRSWTCADTWHECGTGNLNCPSGSTCSDDCCAGGPPPTVTVAPSPTPALFCPINVSCCYFPLTSCTANSQCPTGYRWCYAGICVKENYNPGSNTCVTPTPTSGPVATSTPVPSSTSVPSLPPTSSCRVVNVVASDGQYSDRIYVSWTVQNGNEAQRIDVYQGNNYLTSKSSTDPGQWNFNHQGLSCPAVNNYNIYCWKNNSLYGRGADSGSTACSIPTGMATSTPTPPVGRPTVTPPIILPTPTLRWPTPTPPLAYGAWFQTQDGDVYARGNISDPLSPFPPKIFSLDGEGGFPGVISFGGTSARFGSGSVSSKDWLAKTSLAIRNFRFFYTLLGAPQESSFNGEMVDGDGLYFADGDRVIAGDWNLSGGKRVIILVNGNVRILSNIIVPYGSSLVLVAAGDITFDNHVSQAQGFFLADKKISTGTGQTAFEGEGGFLAGQEMVLRRDFRDSRNRFTPAEKFIFRPDLVINSLMDFWSFGHVWEELAP